MGLFDWLKKKEPPSLPSPKPVPARTVAWNVGDRVLAKWFDDFFYPGRIREVHGPYCQIHYDDGDAAWVHGAHLLLPDIGIGSRVFGRLRGGPHFALGVVTQQKAEAILVRYDHGEEEWTSISFVRVQRPIANVGDEALAPGQNPPNLAKQNIDLGDPLEGSDWRAGDRVLGRGMDFFWYPGTILNLGAKGFHIFFDDGGQLVIPENKIMPLVIEEGEQLYIRPKADQQRQYTLATVTRVAGEILDVEFEDGHRETNLRASRARFWRCPVGFQTMPFEEGDRVLAFDMDQYLYPAEIVSIQDDRIIVQYLDGPERMLTPELLRRFEMKPGGKMECRWKGGPTYFPGLLRQVEGERVFVKYDDGDEEWTSARLVRFPNPQAKPK